MIHGGSSATRSTLSAAVVTVERSESISDTAPGGLRTPRNAAHAAGSRANKSFATASYGLLMRGRSPCPAQYTRGHANTPAGGGVVPAGNRGP